MGTQEHQLRSSKGQPNSDSDVHTGIPKRINLGICPSARVDSPRQIPLVLASGSPSKKNLLGLLGLTFSVDPANIDESVVKAQSPEFLVQTLASMKAHRVAERHPHTIVLAADTLIVDEIGYIGKPLDAAHAKEILTRLSGRSHRVITGLCLLETETKHCVDRLTTTVVTFRTLSAAMISRYVDTGEPFNKAGAYALQGIGALLVARVDGDHTNVLGLPIPSLVDAMAELGYRLL